jgi:hypothetical protein
MSTFSPATRNKQQQATASSSKQQRQTTTGSPSHNAIHGLQDTNASLTSIFTSQEVFRDVDPSVQRSLAPPHDRVVDAAARSAADAAADRMGAG